MSNTKSEEQVIVELKNVAGQVVDYLKNNNIIFFDLFAAKSGNEVFGNEISDLEYIKQNNDDQGQLYFLTSPRDSKAFYFNAKRSNYIAVVDIHENGFVVVDFDEDGHTEEVFDTYSEVKCEYNFDQKDFFDIFNIKKVDALIEYLKDLIK